MNENKTYAPSLAVDFADDVFDFVAVKAVLLQGRDQALTREVSVGAAVFLGVEKVTKRHTRVSRWCVARRAHRVSQGTLSAAGCDSMILTQE